MRVISEVITKLVDSFGGPIFKEESLFLSLSATIINESFNQKYQKYSGPCVSNLARINFMRNMRNDHVEERCITRAT